MRYPRLMNINSAVVKPCKALVLFLLLGLSLAGCGERPAVEAESVLNRGTGAEPESLDAQKARSTQAGDIQRDLGEGLAGYTPTGELVAAAAESWDRSDDGRRYTFQLRADARWSNGEPVTAADFVYSFRRLVNPETAAFYAEFVGDIVNASRIISGELETTELGVSANGDLELEITLAHPVPYFPELLTHPATFPVHQKSVEAFGDAHARPGNLVTNGAYKLQSWQVGSFIELVRNDHYWNNKATAIDRVRHHVTPQPLAELNRYRAGELDTTSNIAPEMFAQMQAERPDEVRVSPALGTYFYGFNLSKPPFADNPKLREALSMAIDREVIVETVIGRGEEPAFSFVPPGVNNYNARRFSFADIPTEERHKTARQLYREAGYSRGNPLRIEVRYNTAESHRRIALAIQSMWQEVLGVEATLVNEEFQVLLSNISAAEVTQVFKAGWNGDYNDANTFLSILESDNPANMPHYQNVEYDELMQRAATATDLQERQLWLEEAETLMMRDHPIIPIYFFVNKSMVSPRLGGWGDNVLNYHYSQHLSLRNP